MSNVDKDKIKRAVRDILEAIGEDPDREGLLDTPDRVARMYEEIYSGIGCYIPYSSFTKWNAYFKTLQWYSASGWANTQF